jgi:hypothetical protein
MSKPLAPTKRRNCRPRSNTKERCRGRGRGTWGCLQRRIHDEVRFTFAENATSLRLLLTGFYDGGKCRGFRQAHGLLRWATRGAGVRVAGEARGQAVGRGGTMTRLRWGWKWQRSWTKRRGEEAGEDREIFFWMTQWKDNDGRLVSHEELRVYSRASHRKILDSPSRGEWGLFYREEDSREREREPHVSDRTAIIFRRCGSFSCRLVLPDSYIVISRQCQGCEC